MHGGGLAAQTLVRSLQPTKRTWADLRGRGCALCCLAAKVWANTNFNPSPGGRLSQKSHGFDAPIFKVRLNFAKGPHRAVSHRLLERTSTSRSLAVASIAFSMARAAGPVSAESLWRSTRRKGHRIEGDLSSTLDLPACVPFAELTIEAMDCAIDGLNAATSQPIRAANLAAARGFSGIEPLRYWLVALWPNPSRSERSSWVTAAPASEQATCHDLNIVFRRLASRFCSRVNSFAGMAIAY